MPSIRERLQSGRPQFGMAFSWPAPGIIEAVAKHFDFCWIDAQHGAWDYAGLVDAVRACDLVDRPSLVRVADHSYGRIGRVLDMAASGVILPCVDTAEQARAIVEAACFPPLGNRSFGGRRVVDLHGREYAFNPDLLPLVIAQVETPRALENIAAIAATDGIDVLFFGPDDVKLRLGYPIDTPMHAAEMAPLVRKVAEVCRQHGKYAMSVSGNPDDIRLMLDAGFSLINVAADAGFIRRAAAESAAMVAGLL